MTDAMTARTVGTAADPDTEAPPRVRPTPPPLATTASVIGGGHLTWLGWTWAVTGVLFVVAMGLILRVDGHLEESLWQAAGASWQRYVIFAAGATTVTTYLVMFVANGTTRSQLSASSTVAMVAVAGCGALFVVAGFLVEGLFSGAGGWTHEMSDGNPMVSGAGFVVLGLRYAVLFCLWFSAGWLIGTGYYRYGFFGGTALIVPFAVPVLLGELLVGQEAAAINIDVITDWVSTPAPLALLIGVGLIAANATIARAFTRGTPVRC